MVDTLRPYGPASAPCAQRATRVGCGQAACTRLANERTPPFRVPIPASASSSRPRTPLAGFSTPPQAVPTRVTDRLTPEPSRSGAGWSKRGPGAAGGTPYRHRQIRYQERDLRILAPPVNRRRVQQLPEAVKVPLRAAPVNTVVSPVTVPPKAVRRAWRLRDPTRPRLYPPPVTEECAQIRAGRPRRPLRTPVRRAPSLRPRPAIITRAASRRRARTNLPTPPRVSAPRPRSTMTTCSARDAPTAGRRDLLSRRLRRTRGTSVPLPAAADLGCAGSGSTRVPCRSSRRDRASASATGAAQRTGQRETCSRTRTCTRARSTRRGCI